MIDGDSTCADPAQGLDAHERARAHEIAAYLSAASFPFDAPDGPPAIPVPSTDITLNALVQHGVHKMECDRAFLSFIDNRSQFICSEMTRHQSITDTSPTQPLLLGATRIALEWGVCPYTMSIFHGRGAALPASPYIIANEAYFYIEDFRQIPSFADRPFVAGYPHMVSYIEVPLRSLSGHILGSYCVVDDKPRDFLQPNALRSIQEVALAISKYLDLKRVEEGRMRSEKMMNGLRQFVGSHQSTEIDSANTKGPFSLDIFEERAPNCPVDVKAPPEALRISDSDSTPDVCEINTASPCDDINSKQSTSGLSNQITNLLPKAANLIGHAMNLDGLVFFDAVETGTRYRGNQSLFCSTDEEPAPLDNHRDSLPAQPLSEYQRDATTRQSMVRWPSQSLMQRLITAYPHGHLFTVDEYGVFAQEAQESTASQGPSSEVTTHNEWEELFDCIPKARYALFLPLWHYQRESCFSTCLAWMSEPGKTLEMNDLNSLTAFGHSLMAELFRLEAATSTQQKSDFISSVSHELRSPLHGILASAELMQEDLQDSRLLSLTQMIESCSHTLLDTFDHLLEFSKINSHKGTRQSVQLASVKFNAGSAATEKSGIDLGSTIEDVLEAVLLGHTSAMQLGIGLKREHQDPLSSGAGGSSLPVLITTYIDHNFDWNSNMNPGAWKRILLNILSNALRFTESGYIDISLKMLEETSTRPRCINLSVTDTGVGMSPEFLKYHLFTPFMQENSLISGTGLGIRIVKSIVESLGGKIFVESRQHEGTCVSVNIPSDKGLGTLCQADDVGSLAPYDRLSNLTVGLISIAAQNAPNAKPALHMVTLPKLLRRCLQNICADHFNMLVADDLPMNMLLKKDVVLLDTHALSSVEMLDVQAQFPELVSAMGSRPVIVLGPTTKGVAQSFRSKGAIFVSSPITRKTLQNAIITALDKAAPAEAVPPQPSRVDGQSSFHQAESSFPKPPEDEPATIQHKPVDLPVRSASSRGRLDGMGDLPPNPEQLDRPPARLPHTTLADFPGSPVAYRFRRLLLVDDNPINLKLLVAFVKKTGLPFATASEGSAAVRLYKKAAVEDDPFDCVFMDISMPVMDGFQATAAIRQFEEERWKEHQGRANGKERPFRRDNESQKATPHKEVRPNIFALTGLGSDEARSKALKSGFDLFLMKPLKFKSIEPLLRPSTVNRGA